jgi:hypothetical protein
MHELRVVNALSLDSCGNPGDPKGTEIPFLPAAVTVGVLPCFSDSILGNTIVSTTASPVSFGLFDDLLSSVLVFGSVYSSWHSSLLP